MGSTDASGGPLKLNNPNVQTLVSQLGEISHAMQQVLTNYQNANWDAIGHQAVGGQYANTSAMTGDEVTRAQMKIQTRFRMINETLSSGGTQIDNAQQEAASNIVQVQGLIRFP